MNFFNTQTVQSLDSVQYSKEYSNFKFLPWNRDIKDPNLQDLIKKIGRNGQQDPGKVDEENNIQDGQHRFLACKHLGVPFKFLRVNSNEIDIVQLNTTRSNWVISDYQKYYLKQDFNEYLKFDNLINTFPKYTISALLKTIYVKPKQFREGSLSITPQVYSRAQELLETIDKNLSWFEGSTHTSFITALCNYYIKDEFDLDAFIHKVNRYKGKVYVCSSVSEYGRMIKKVYNFKNRKRI